MQIHIPDYPFRGYIFDCDGTLAHSMPVHYRAWTKVIQELGGEFPEDLFYSLGGTPSRRIIEILNEKFGLSMDVHATAERKEDLYFELLHEVLPIHEVVALVHEFRGKAPIAVASGGYRRLVHGTLEAIGILDAFDAIVCAEDTERGKPHPDPFLEAARRLEIDPKDILVFEDAEPGVQAAKAAGMQVVVIPTPGY